MPNILHFTEQFDNSYWSAFDSCTRTADTHAAPVFAGDDAGLADTLDDASGAAGGSLFGTYETIPNDTSTWTASLYVRKTGDATPDFFPLFGVQINGGTQLFPSVSMNTYSGVVASGGDGAPDDMGVEDIDATWWRPWWSKANNNTGNTIARLYIYPAYSGTIGAGNDGTKIGSIIIWGANLTNTPTVGVYEPEPFYEFPETGWDDLATLGAGANRYTDLTVVPGTIYDYRVVAHNTVGTSQSNITQSARRPFMQPKVPPFRAGYRRGFGA